MKITRKKVEPNSQILLQSYSLLHPTNSERNVNGNGLFRLPENRAHLGLTRLRPRRGGAAAQVWLQARVFGDGGFEAWREL